MTGFWRAFVIALALTLLALSLAPAPASAQFAPDACKYAQTQQAYTDCMTARLMSGQQSSIGTAIVNTINQNYARTNTPVPTDLWTRVQNQVASEVAFYKQNAGDGAAGWLNIAKSLIGMATPLPLGTAATGAYPGDGGFYGNDGGWGGGGASNTGWDPGAEGVDCEAYKVDFDADGHFIVPAIKLKGGKPMVPGQQNGPPPDAWRGNGQLFGMSQHYIQAFDFKAVMLWGIHNYNKTRGVDNRAWLGLWAANPDTGAAYYCSMAYYDSNNVKQPQKCLAVDQFANNNYYIDGFPTNKPCPIGGATGGSFDFYANNEGGDSFYYMQGCTEYAPNMALSPSGYIYPKYIALPDTAFRAFPQGGPNSIYACGVTVEWLRAMADAISKKAAPGTYHPITTDDVRTGGKNPQFGDLAKTPTTPASPGSSTTPTPPAGGTGGTGNTGGGTTTNTTVDLGPNPAIPEPTVAEPSTSIMDPIFNWMPKLKTLTVATSGAPCPTFPVNLTAFGGPKWSFTIDKHCELAEANRAAIGALMVAVWGIAAAVVILRA